ncbi:MAG: hypothetical protein NTY19_44970 [Planctomycetota bacterium]|nr:hypothetical protein [Planctomycetota bacterium]
MTTIIDLTDQELAELKTLTNQADAASAVRCATTEYLRFARRKRLQELSGRVEMEENWTVLEAAELKEPHGSC